MQPRKSKDRRKSPRLSAAWYRDHRVVQAVAMELAALEPRLLCCTDGGHYHPSPPVFNPWPTFGGQAVVQPQQQQMGPYATGMLGSGTFTNPLSSIPALNSNSGASATLYLDFDGASAQAWGSYNVTTTPAYSQDSDTTTFSDAELTAIQQIWARVAESYSPFNINVTTVDPGNLSDGHTIKVVVGGSGGWLGQSAGGVSYVGSFYNSAPNVAWVFPNMLGGGNTKYTADAIAHESGHAFGLQHQSAYSGTSKTAEYRGGTASIGVIMGNSYYSTRALWSNGQSSLGYSVYQDDMAVIANNSNGFGYRTDDHGNTIGNADALSLSGADVSGSGVIERTSDVDVFSFVTSAGQVSFNVDVASYGAMLDATLQLVDVDGNVVATADTSNLGESITATVAEGSYRLIVSSKGNYGDVGQYTVTGTIVPSPNYIAPPSHVTGTPGAGGVTLSWYDNAWNETGYTIQRSDDGGNTWSDLATVGDGVTGYLDATAVVGTTYKYRVFAFNDTDQSGNSTAATVNVTPATPGSLSAASISSSRIDLSWADVDGESGYVIERSLNGSTWSALTTVNADQTTYSDTGLVAGTRYYYRIRANSAVGASANASAVNAYTRVAAPTLTLTVVSTSQINLTWTNVLNETGYRIERSLNGTDWSTLATTAANVISYSNTALSAGTQYFYRVIAVNQGGDSTAGTANKTTLLAAPTGLSASGVSTTQVNLTWNDSTGETGYVIERSLNNLNWAAIATVNADVTSYSNTGLVGGTRYYYRIRAVNAGGNSLPSASNSSYTIPLTPTLSGTVISDTQINLSWTNVSGELSYILQRSADGQSGWSTIASPLANVITYSNTGLTADTDYYYRVVARNDSGDSTASAVVARHTFLPAVTGLTATAVSTTGIDLQWTDATGESGYKVERSTNGLTWVLIASPTADATTYSDTGLAAGTTYFYRVHAVNAGGWSLTPERASTITLPLSTTVTVLATSTTSIKLSWLNVNGESGYRIERSLDGADWSTLTTVAANVITYTNTGLTTDTSYYYRVTAYNASGDGATSTAKNTRTLLTAPTNLAATAVSTSQVNLTWDDSTGETGYVVERSLNGTTWSVLTTLAADVTSYSNTGLVAGTSYQYRVRAANAGGNSEAGVKAVVTTIPAGVNVTATAASTSQINLSWTNVLGETGYRVEYSTDGSNWSTLVTKAANAYTYSHTGLTADTQYYYRVTAFNASGEGATSAVVSRRTLMPAAASFTASAASTTSITLTWLPQTGETGYKLERYNGKTWALIATLGADVHTYTNTGLLAGRTYSYRLRTTNAGGDSAPSAVASATTPASAPVVRSTTVKSLFQSTNPILHAA